MFAEPPGGDPAASETFDDLCVLVGVELLIVSLIVRDVAVDVTVASPCDRERLWNYT